MQIGGEHLSEHDLYEDHGTSELLARETEDEVTRSAEAKRSECYAPTAVRQRCELFEGGLGI